jgi:AcrR family transcriptional regulator
MTSTAPRTRKAPAERRDEILAAARAVALEQGLAALTLRSVAARAGVASGLVAHYVDGMDDLVAGTFAAIVGAELREVEAFIDALPDPVAGFRALIDTLLEPARNEVTLVWVQAWALGFRNEALAGAVRAQMDAWQTFIAGLLDRGVATGALTVPDTGAAAWQLLAMIDGLNAHSLVLWHDAPDRRELTQRTAAALVGLHHGLDHPSEGIS